MKNCLTPQNPKMCDPILVTLFKMRPHNSQSSCENATPSSSTSPLASYKEVTPPSGLYKHHHDISNDILPYLCSEKTDYLAIQVYRAFSLTWPASMLIYWNKRKHLHEKRVQLPEDFLGTPTRPPFHCFGTPIWPP